MKVKRLLENYISTAIENAKSDRKRAYSLLAELEEEMAEVKGNDLEKNERAGETAAKYIRAIQSSNKQIIDVIKELRRISESEGEDKDYSVEGGDIYEDIEEVTLGDLEQEDAE